MKNTKGFVVIVYNRSHCFTGVFGLFKDRKTAESWVKAIGIANYRIAELLQPLEAQNGV